MPKTPKTEAVTDDAPATDNGSAPAADATATRAKKRTKSAKAPAARKGAAKKKSTSGAAKKTKPKRTTPAGEPTEPSDADIRLRAYFIAERRVQLALQGDPAKDWLEARQQLIEESRQPTS